MRRWLAQHGRAVRNAGTHLLADPLGTLLCVALIGVTSALAMLFYVAVEQLRDLPSRLAVSPEVTIFLSTEANDRDRAALEGKLRSYPEVETVRFVARDAALADLARTLEAPDLMHAFASNPLPDAYVVTFRGSQRERPQRLKAEAANWPKVDHAQLDDEWVLKLSSLERAGRFLVWFLGTTLAIVVIGSTFVNVRLQILRRAGEIEIQALLGATAAFVRRPFIYFGIAEGLLGGVAGTVALLGLSLYGQPMLESLAQLYGVAPQPLLGLTLQLGAVAVLACAALGGLGAAISSGFSGVGGDA